MPRVRQLRQRIRDGETVLGTFLNLGSAVAAEICAAGGFDWLLVDLEHGAGTEADLLPQLQAIAGRGAAAIVRPERSDRLRISRALDLGADGVMLPRVDSAREASAAVRHLRYPPGGIRGVALMTRGAQYGAIAHAEVAGVNDELLCMVQIESPEAVAAAPAIAAVDGVDVLFVGPTDLTHTMGIPGRIEDPRYEEAITEVAGAAEEAGKAAGVLLWRLEDMERYVRLGYRFFAVSSDGAILAAGARALVRSFRERGAGGAPPT